MARAYPPDRIDYAPSAPAGEWQALRGELMALLDQVEDQVAQNDADDYDGIARRLRDLRQQVGQDATVGRQREALRSVKRAVERFNEREDMVPQHSPQLASAIDEIRARQNIVAPMPRLPNEPPVGPRFDELARSMGAMTGRLERLEGELRTQRDSGGSVREIAEQVQQLTQVVELLAGAVGETGQVKRLEGQIAGIAKLLSQPLKADSTGLARRLDELSGTIEKLADIQVKQVERNIKGEESRERSQTEGLRAIETGVRNLYDRIDGIKTLETGMAGQAEGLDVIGMGVKAIAERIDGLKGIERGMKGIAEKVDAMGAIETSVRNIYDRLDTLEKSVAVSPADMDRLSSEMRAFTDAMKAGPMLTVPEALLNKVDALNTSLAEMGNRDTGAVAGLQQDVGALRDAVLGAFEPRFNALEEQIGVIATKVNKQKDDKSVGHLEAQIRQLVARMDQTGEQLSGLARLYAENQASQPDFDGLADIVVKRTTEALGKRPNASGLNAEALGAIEERVARLVEAARPAPATEDLAVVHSGIERVNDRLERLEAMLNRLPEKAAPLAADVAAPAAASDPVMAPPRVESSFGFDDLTPVRMALEDRLGEPSEPLAVPVEDRPAARPDPDSLLVLPVSPATEPVTPTATGMPTPRQIVPPFDADRVARPARPKSQLLRDATSIASEPVSSRQPAVAGTSTASRNTFIEAARRAAQKQARPAPAELAPNSLIGKALSRFQIKSAEDKQPSIKPTAANTLSPATDRRPRKAEQTKVDAAAIVAPELAAAASAEPNESFLSRYRRPILLAATLVAVGLLTANLIGQRLGGASPATANSIQETTETASGDTLGMTDTAPRVIEPAGSLLNPAAEPTVLAALDDISVGAINPSDSLLAFNPVVDNRMPDQLPSDSFSLPQVDLPATLDLPPDSLGPAELRQAAANGDPRAQFEIAAIYTEGRAVPQDLAAAAVWYEQSAAQGFAPSQYRLGNLYETGSGVAKDLEAARIWYVEAAEAGNRMSMHNLASLYAGGELGTQDFAQAARWFEAAANLGMRDSQFNLGMLYARGLGVPQNLEASFKWFSLAAAQGDTDAAAARDDIARSLDAETVSRVGLELAGWQQASIDVQANFAPIGTWSDSFDPGQSIDNREVVQQVQALLARLGYDVGDPDGLAGPKTVDAIKAFERSTGMSEVGAINPRLLAVLGSQPV